jgi:DNA-directed RNA polymerase specialized sigma24 family protein
VRRGRSPAEAEARAQDLLGDLASPPARGGARTLLGLYDAAGSLFGWLCVVLVRRVAADQRGRQTGTLDVLPEDALADARRVASGPEAGASDARAAGGEHVARFSAALPAAWADLSAQEKLALLWKHRDGLTQRQVGALLGLGEARVSRIVTAALARLAAHLKPVLGAALPEEAEFRALLAGALARHLAREAPAPAPSRGTRAPEGRTTP